VTFPFLSERLGSVGTQWDERYEITCPLRLNGRVNRAVIMAVIQIEYAVKYSSIWHMNLNLRPRPAPPQPWTRLFTRFDPNTSQIYQESMQRIARPVGPLARHQASATSKWTTSHARTLYSSTHHDGNGHVHGVNEVRNIVLVVAPAKNLIRTFGRTILFSRYYVLGRRFETRRHILHRLDLKPNHCLPPSPNPLQLKRRPRMMFGPFHIPLFKKS